MYPMTVDGITSLTWGMRRGFMEKPKIKLSQQLYLVFKVGSGLSQAKGMNQHKVRESNYFSVTRNECKHAGTRDKQAGETETKS